LAGPARPVDELLARLHTADGPAWLRAVLTAVVQDTATSAKNLSIEEFLNGGADVGQLEKIKDYGKRLLKSAASPADRCSGLVAYFWSIAAALRRHGVLIGARRADQGQVPRDELHDALLDLAAATDEPWSAMLAEAALRVRQAMT
jgi:hypothetical protein